ncbi:eukaryotic translation initiation factor 4E transporter-like [Limulus polyphemus]|uniref:Eukaryotic translation initiation factor 4E transporter-like n=1 Tax=Limulus polyphemus TaxID=6850 RepID=A0ABM1T7I9_LIMPO|nr:eukaryotic translation initiation factor 4E transporter-like [Limulus polyphemus]XP_022251845.1 eukaryotic translation initiation factor 4E transporter-like [Limulus polyphemus]
MAMVEQATSMSSSVSFEIEVKGIPKEAESKHGQQSNGSSRSSSRASSKSRNSPKPLPQYQYTKDQLLEISLSESAKKRPEFLNVEHYNSSGLWDPLNWFASLRNEEFPPSDDFQPKRSAELDRDSNIPPKRRPSGPRERIKEERDDIILSPQRRSFRTGCHVNQQSSLARKASSPADPHELESIIHREPTRRIGSGRIATRDRDRDHPERDYGYSRWGGDHREERDKEGNRYNGHYGERKFRRSRSRDYGKEEEPEWISGGPTSQSETIELIGFDDLEKAKAEEKISNEVNSDQPNNKMEVSNEDSFNKACVPVGDKSEENGEIHDEVEHSENEKQTRDPSPGFDFNEIFQMELVPGIVANGNTEKLKPNIPLENSRFSNWFQNVTKEVDSQHSHFPNELVVNMLKDIDVSHSLMEFSPPIDSSDASFLPINHSLPQNIFQEGLQFCQNSCTASQDQQSKPREGRNILDILKNANINIQPLLNGDTSETSDLKEKELAQKARSVEEIEADLKQLVLGGKDKEQEKISPLNKLLTHLRTDGNSPLPISLGPLDQSMVLQEADIVGALKSEPGKTSFQPRTNPSLTQKLPCVARSFQDTQQVDRSLHLPNQMTLNVLNVREDETLYKPAEQDLFGNTVSSTESNINNKHHALQAQDSEDRELLSVLLPSLSSYSHDSSLKHSLVLSQRQSPLPSDGHCRIPSPLVFGQQPPVLSYAPAPIHPNQFTRKPNPLQIETSPVMPRIPSPQELAVHTQSILQNALIKYSLVEQEEKYKKLQESQRTQSPNISLSMNNSSPPKGLSPTMAAFTPTSVIRKIHTDMSNRTSVKPGLRNGVGGLKNVAVSQSMKLGHDVPTTNSLGIGFFPSHVMGIDHFLRSEGGSAEINGVQTSRAVHGQGASRLQGNGQHFTAQGRPIVKAAGGYYLNGDQYSRPGSKFSIAPNKPFAISHYQNPPDPVSMVTEQHRFQPHQQHPHSFVNINQPPPNHFSVTSHPPGPILGNTPNALTLGRQGNSVNSFSQHFHSGDINASTARGPSNTSNQLARLLSQQQQGFSQGRGIPNQLALQQLLFTAQHQSVSSQDQSVNLENMHAVNIRGDGRGDVALRSYPSNRGQQLVQGHQLNTNLAKWFGSEVLKEKLPEMPPVPLQRAVLVEELERQQREHSLEH